MKSWLNSFAWAFRGIYLTFKSERNFRVHILATILVIVLGIFLSLSLMEWGLIVFSIGLVLVAELFNTSIERLGAKACDNKPDQFVKNAKDIAAAAVLLSAITALVIGILVLFIPLVRKILEWL